MPYSPIFASEAAAWKAFQAGDTTAFEQLYRIHARPLLTYGRRLCSDADQVADAVQDVFLEIWKRRATLTVPESTRLYLFRILRNRLINQLTGRKDPLHQALALTEIGELFSVPSVESERTEADTQLQQQVRLRQAIDQLPPRQREALLLAFYHQCSNEDIAQIMSINPQSVTNHLNRAIGTLRQLLTGIFWLIIVLLFV